MAMMASRWIAAALLLAAFALFCTGCVSVPIPPTDMGSTKAGDLGSLNVRVVCEYKPNWTGMASAALRQWSGDEKTVKEPSK
jgi:hypothetical protein